MEPNRSFVKCFGVLIPPWITSAPRSPVRLRLVKFNKIHRAYFFCHSLDFDGCFRVIRYIMMFLNSRLSVTIHFDLSVSIMICLFIQYE